MENQLKITKEITVTDQDIDDIMVTALEGGINYWCCKAVVKDKDYKGAKYASDVISKGGIIRFYNAEDECETWEMDKKTLLKGLTDAISDNYIKTEEDGTIDIANIDADGADIIIQYALFDAIVYG